MLLRAAILVPLALAAVLVVVIAAGVLSDESPSTGLADDQRVAFFLTLPPVCLFMSMWVSGMFVAWLGGWWALPGWLRIFLRGETRPRRRRGHDLDLKRGVVEFADPLSSRAKVWFAAYLFIMSTFLLALSVPVYALLLLWLARGVYAPWEAAVVGGAGIGTLTWFGFLGLRLRSKARTGSRSRA